VQTTLQAEIRFRDPDKLDERKRCDQPWALRRGAWGLLIPEAGAMEFASLGREAAEDLTVVTVSGSQDRVLIAGAREWDSMEQEHSRKIRQYWNTQAEEFGADPRATTPDHWLREIEIAAVSRVLSSLDDGATVLDIGCGNGYSTLRLATDHPAHQFVGGDYAPAMIARAREALEDVGPNSRKWTSSRLASIVPTT
jgi:hypothetical protein